MFSFIPEPISVGIIVALFAVAAVAFALGNSIGWILGYLAVSRNKTSDGKEKEDPVVHDSSVSTLSRPKVNTWVTS